MKRTGLVFVIVAIASLVGMSSWAAGASLGHGGTVTTHVTLSIGVGDEDLTAPSVGVAPGSSSAMAAALYTGTLSYNESCKCNQCSGAAKDCSARAVVSGDPGYKSAWKKGSYEATEDGGWSCMPPAADCYVVITK